MSQTGLTLIQRDDDWTEIWPGRPGSDLTRLTDCLWAQDHLSHCDDGCVDGISAQELILRTGFTDRMDITVWQTAHNGTPTDTRSSQGSIVVVIVLPKSRFCLLPRWSGLMGSYCADRSGASLNDVFIWLSAEGKQRNVQRLKVQLTSKLHQCSYTGYEAPSTSPETQTGYELHRSKAYWAVWTAVPLVHVIIGLRHVVSITLTGSYGNYVTSGLYRNPYKEDPPLRYFY